LCVCVCVCVCVCALCYSQTRIISAWSVGVRLLNPLKLRTSKLLVSGRASIGFSITVASLGRYQWTGVPSQQKPTRSSPLTKRVPDRPFDLARASGAISTTIVCKNESGSCHLGKSPCDERHMRPTRHSPFPIFFLVARQVALPLHARSIQAKASCRGFPHNSNQLHTFNDTTGTNCKEKTGTNCKEKNL
jgi:hypothetical protein